MESSTVSRSILMIEETVDMGQRLSLHFSSLSFPWPRMCHTGSLPFLNEHWTNCRLYITARDEDHGRKNSHPIAAFHLKTMWKADLFYMK